MFTRTRNRRRRAVLTAAAAALVLGAAACGSDDEDTAEAMDDLTATAVAGTDAAAAEVSAPVDTSDAGADPLKSASPCDTKCSFSIQIHVTNKSSHDLLFVKNDTNHNDGSTVPAPAARIAAHGGTDSFEFKTSASFGAEYAPIWRVDGTEDEVVGFFQVPTIGANEVGCSHNNMRPAPSYMDSVCSIQHGYHPNAQFVVNDR